MWFATLINMLKQLYLVNTKCINSAPIEIIWTKAIVMIIAVISFRFFNLNLIKTGIKCSVM